jgi:hypothetical protein
VRMGMGGRQGGELSLDWMCAYARRLMGYLVRVVMDANLPLVSTQ